MYLDQKTDDWSYKERKNQLQKAQPHQGKLPLIQAIALQFWLLLTLTAAAYSGAKADEVGAKADEIPASLVFAQAPTKTFNSEPQPLFNTSSRTHQPTQNSWALVVDNDLFVPGSRDQDYTFGVNFSQSHENLANARFTLNRPLVAIDGLLGLESTDTTHYSRELGVYAFTPEDITLKEANPQDRPYASLVYFASSAERINSLNNSAIRTSFSLGLLGTEFPSQLQKEVHRYTQSTPAEGWHNQISKGGELTARYQIAYQQQLNTGSANIELKSTSQLSIGYLTEASWGLSFRKGLINSAWTSFNPELTSYGEKAAFDSNNKRAFEHYLWGGFAVKARAFNAFMEGQWRDSAVTYSRGQLNSLLVEGWLGYTLAFNNGYKISYVLRGHTSEVKEGTGDRDLLWGSLILAKAF